MVAEETHGDRNPRRTSIIEMVGTETWSGLQAIFDAAECEAWLAAAARLSAAGIGSATISRAARDCASIAGHVGAGGSLSLAESAVRLSRTAGSNHVGAFLAASPAAARALGDTAGFRSYLASMEDLGRHVPEAFPAVLGRIEFIFSTLDPDGLRRWLHAGIRLSSASPRMLDHFTSTDADSLGVYRQQGGAVFFGEVERSVRAYLCALFGLRPLIRVVDAESETPARRSGFEGGLVRMPETFPGFAGREARQLFRAAAAHIGAHMMFTETFERRSLKPVQIALVSIMEDARVEHLAMRELPGLGRLWRSFHVAEPDRMRLALPLMARLSRALIDERYQDPDPWVRKGRESFFDNRSRWDDQGISRTIGALLGNDLGQMRIQFNARTYVVQPPYRDDNLGIWDFDPPDASSVEAETIFDSVRIERTEDKTRTHERQRMEESEREAHPARWTAIDDDAGIPVARYPEWDYSIGQARNDWSTVLEYEPRPASAGVVDRIEAEYADILGRVKRLVRSAQVSRLVRRRRQSEGERLDLTAAIGAAIDQRAGIVPDPRVYESTTFRGRDLSILVLLDVSESTKDFVAGTTTTIFSLERAATVLLAEAMEGSGDAFAIHAFCSNGRSDVRYVRVKEFAERFGPQAKARLAGLRGGYSTRMGAALRHAGSELARQATYRRLLLIVTDGEPSDIDVPDQKYLVEDARKAVQDLVHNGIDVFCVALDRSGDDYLTRIFGRRSVVQIDRLAALPEKLPTLYFRLTR